MFTTLFFLFPGFSGYTAPVVTPQDIWSLAQRQTRWTLTQRATQWTVVER